MTLLPLAFAPLWAVIAAVGAAIAATVGVVWSLRANAERRDAAEDAALQEGYRNFNTEVITLFEQLEALKKRHEMLTFNDLDYSDKMTGATLTAYHQLEHEIDDLRAEWMDVMDVRQEIKDVVEAAPRLDEEQEQRVANLLKTRDRLAPLRDLHQRCITGMEQLESAHENLADGFAEIKKLATLAEEHHTALLKAGVTPTVLQEDARECRNLLRQAESTRSADPLGMRELLPELTDRIQTWETWLASLRHAREQVDAVLTELETVRQTIEQHRNQGLHLTGHTADPEPLLRDAEHECNEVLRCIDRGNEEAANDFLTLAQGSLARAQQRIDDQTKARDFYLRALPEKKLQHRELEDQLDQAASTLQQLQRDHAPESWESVSGHIEQARHLLQGHTELLRQAYDQENQPRDFVKAADQLSRVEHQQQEAAALLQAIPERQRELDQLATETREQAQTLEDHIATFENWSGRYRKKLSSDIETGVSDLHRTRASLQQQMTTAPQNWPLLHEQWRLLEEELQELKADAEEELEAFDQLDQLIDKVQTDNRELGAFLERHEDDRKRPNKTYRALQKHLRDHLQRLEDEEVDWPTMQEAFSTLERQLASIRQYAQHDIDLASQARRSLDEARQEIDRVESFNARGVSARLRLAEKYLTEGERELRQRDYEDAIECGEDSVQASLEALEDAREEVRKRKRQSRERRMDTIATVASIGAGILGEVIRAQSRGRRHRHRRVDWRF